MFRLLFHEPTLPASSVASAKRLNTVFFVSVFLLTAMTATMAMPLLADRQTATVIIEKNFSPRSCRAHASLFHGSKERSDKSGFPDLYCGFVSTDHGSFALPQSTRLDFFGSFFVSTREQLFDLLHEGCPYRVVVSGPGMELSPGQPAIGYNKTLLSAEPVGACALRV